MEPGADRISATFRKKVLMTRSPPGTQCQGQDGSDTLKWPGLPWPGPTLLPGLGLRTPSPHPCPLCPFSSGRKQPQPVTEPHVTHTHALGLQAQGATARLTSDFPALQARSPTCRCGPGWLLLAAPREILSQAPGQGCARVGDIRSTNTSRESAVCWGLAVSSGDRAGNGGPCS